MKKKIGKRNSISLDLPDRLNRTRIKSITYTKQGIINDLKCPECEDGVTFSDYTHARGGDMIPSICDYCEGKGIVDEEKILDVRFDKEGKPYLIYKEM